MNLQADAMTRANQIAARELEQLARDAGTRDRDFRISDRARAIGEHLKSNPQILERAAIEVAAWRKKGRRIRARKPRDFWALLTTVRDAE